MPVSTAVYVRQEVGQAQGMRVLQNGSTDRFSALCKFVNASFHFTLLASSLRRTRGELDAKSFIDAVLDKQVNSMGEESDGLPCIHDFEEDVLYFALATSKRFLCVGWYMREATVQLMCA